LTGPAAGEPDPGWAASPRTGSRDGAVGVLGLLAAALAFRLIIAYVLLPNSGFQVDVGAFRYWAENLASQGLNGFYTRDFFHDYTPGYLYVLWLVGKVGQLFGGGVGDLIKLPPILADAALGWVVWSMARELGASSRAARIGALLVVLNPVSWLDSAIWGQVDSVGTVVLLLALRELWRDRPERSAILTVLAALIKPQLGILIPIVAVVVIRRALWPAGGYGDEPAPVGGATALERRFRGPIRILTTGLAGIATAVVVSLPFGLSLSGLIQQVFSTAGGYPYVSVNAYNPWALVSLNGNGVAANGAWACDTTVLPSGPTTIRLGDFVLFSSSGSTLTCTPAVTFGALPAVLVGALLFLAAALIVVVLVARRPDRRTTLVGLAILALAFFVLPTRVHERYLYPFIGVAAILAAGSLRWRVAYVISSVAMLANMYAILTSTIYATPNIHDWLGIRPALTSFVGVAVAAIAQLVVFVWAFAQLRDDRLEELAEEIEGEPAVAQAAVAGAGLSTPVGRTLPEGAPASAAAAASGAVVLSGAAAASVAPEPGLVPVWDELVSGAGGIVDWFRERFNARPIRADRSAALEGEGGGRLDRLDLWIIAVLVASLLTVRLWRLSEPYGMHFDEVYHARTATEFLQDWRYGISHDIYEWTHPHLAKYAMAIGIEAFGQDRTGATSNLGVPVTGAVIEPRWDPGLDDHAIKGDRLWVATGSEIRAYDLSTRALIATAPLPGAISVAVDPQGHRVFVGTESGEIDTIDTLPMDDARSAGSSASLQASPLLSIGGSIQQLTFIQNPSALAAVLPAANGEQAVVVIDPAAASELRRVTLPDVAQVVDAGGGQIAIANATGLTLLDGATGGVERTLKVGTGAGDLEGPVRGVTDTTDLQDDPMYVTVEGPNGPLVDVVKGTANGASPSKVTSFKLPGDSAGWAFFDHASRMVHVLGSVQHDPARAPTVYVIEPHANAVYADAPLPASPAAIVLDDNGDYEQTDRQQLLSLAADGQVGSVEIGDHALAWRIPGVLAGVIMGALIYVLARLLFRRRWIAGAAAFLVAADGMLFAQSRIGMNDSYVALGIVAAYTLFAWLWLRPGGSRRAWLAFWLGIPLLGVMLGLALASKWVAAYAIGGLGLLVLARSALGRLLLVLALILLTTILGYLAISVPQGQSGGNYLFMFLMIGLTLIAVVANVLHPIAWTWEEERLTYLVPAAAGAAVLAYGFVKGDPAAYLHLGPIAASPLELAFIAFVGAGLVRIAWAFVGTLGFGPRAVVSGQGADVLDPPAPAPVGWLRLGAAWGLPVVWLVLGLLVIPVAVYIASYLPWANVEGHRLWADMTILGINIPAWPPGHTGQTLIDLTGSMYRYHNTLSAAHPASSPWWAWPLDFKPVWFYEEGFAGSTSASIYDAGNLVIWWLSIPAMAFVAFQAFKRRSAALALLAIGFACQWLSWSRIDRAAFQYHYYTSLAFLIIAVAYFLAELWNGASKRTWLLARVAAGVAVLSPFGLWLFHRPLCGLVRVTDVNPGSQACPTYIPDLTITPRAIAIAAIVGIGVLIVVRLLVALEDDDGSEGGLRHRLRNAAIAAIGLSAALGIATFVFKDTGISHLTRIPVEPIALIVTLALLPVAAIVVTARDARRFVIGAFVAIGFWFILWYPNISGLPLPASLHNAYQGFLPTYVYPFQFPVSTVDRNVAGPNLLDARVAALLVAMVVVTLVVGYSAWTWRIALAERRREEAGWGGEPAAP